MSVAGSRLAGQPACCGGRCSRRRGRRTCLRSPRPLLGIKDDTVTKLLFAGDEHVAGHILHNVPRPHKPASCAPLPAGAELDLAVGTEQIDQGPTRFFRRRHSMQVEKVAEALNQGRRSPPSQELEQLPYVMMPGRLDPRRIRERQRRTVLDEQFHDATDGNLFVLSQVREPVREFVGAFNITIQDSRYAMRVMIHCKLYFELNGRQAGSTISVGPPSDKTPVFYYLDDSRQE